ncbi:hypothetical protein G3R49_12240 [Shewanella sp. WXL01]|uniref:hypothetical protein n=1 Tax=Shewanella sp. WXL01 TaxID=2709721 RepID=UPI0014385B5D|nr:hypothetical protein [Shewanella sp. WXL01]NKF51326.1 hypothetical protein [Shewanella sp. WXL01]
MLCKHFGLLAGLALAVMTLSMSKAYAGQVVVRKSSEPFDAFAIRDHVRELHQWKESIRFQEQIKIIQSLPVGCITVVTPYRYYHCGLNFYRPYEYKGITHFVQVDPPIQVESPR